MNKLKLIVTVMSIWLTATSFQYIATLKGTWQFVGGIYNGKKEGATVDYALRRKYKAGQYEAFIIEKDAKPEKFEAGNYVIVGDTCIDTETFCSQPSKIVNIPIHYFYTLRNDTLTLKGILPTSMRVEEYWKRIK